VPLFLHEKLNNMVTVVPKVPNILVIRHEPCSGLGMLANGFKDKIVRFRYLDTPAGEILSEPLSDYSHIVVLGGPISAYEADQYPFLHYEFKLLEEAIERQIPTLGICLGSQILAHVLGARVYRGERGREAGWCDLQLTDSATNDPLFTGFPQQFKVFESHQDTFDLPSGCVHLAFSGLYPNQAFRYQNHVWSIQFHIEIDDSVLSACGHIIEQELADSKITDTTLEQLLTEARQHAPAVAPLAARFMQQFLQVESSQLVVQ
jgi:GMP synthase-like glutamine amidotransferase